MKKHSIEIVMERSTLFGGKIIEMVGLLGLSVSCSFECLVDLYRPGNREAIRPMAQPLTCQLCLGLELVYETQFSKIILIKKFIKITQTMGKRLYNYIYCNVPFPSQNFIKLLCFALMLHLDEIVLCVFNLLLLHADHIPLIYICVLFINLWTLICYTGQTIQSFFYGRSFTVNSFLF